MEGEFACAPRITPTDELVRLFLNNESLLRIMTYMCRSGADPITNTLYTMLTTEARFTVNKYGLVLFKGHPPYPWAYMDWRQREHLYELVRHMGDRHHAAYATESPLTYTVENSHVMFDVSVKLPMTQVFDVMLLALEQSKRASKMLLNILLQKLGAKMLVPREMLLYVWEHSKLKDL